LLYGAFVTQISSANFPQKNQSPGPMEPTRSELKRRMYRLQYLGVRLVDLTPGQFARLDLPEALRDAVLECKKLTSMGARRRQLQFIGRIMEQFDTSAIARSLRDVNDACLVSKKPNPSESVVRDLISADDQFLFDSYSNIMDSTELQGVRQALRRIRKKLGTGFDAQSDIQDLARKFVTLAKNYEIN
jgi:ribosome-associated protein